MPVALSGLPVASRRAVEYRSGPLGDGLRATTQALDVSRCGRRLGVADEPGHVPDGLIAVDEQGRDHLATAGVGAEVRFDTDALAGSLHQLGARLSQHQTAGRGGEHEVDLLAFVGMGLPVRGGGAFGGLDLAPPGAESDHRGHQLVLAADTVGFSGRFRGGGGRKCKAGPLGRQADGGPARAGRALTCGAAGGQRRGPARRHPATAPGSARTRARHIRRCSPHTRRRPTQLSGYGAVDDVFEARRKVRHSTTPSRGTYVWPMHLSAPATRYGGRGLAS